MLFLSIRKYYWRDRMHWTKSLMCVACPMGQCRRLFCLGTFMRNIKMVNFIGKDNQKGYPDVKEQFLL